MLYLRDFYFTAVKKYTARFILNVRTSIAYSSTNTVIKLFNRITEILHQLRINFYRNIDNYDFILKLICQNKVTLGMDVSFCLIQ